MPLTTSATLESRKVILLSVDKDYFKYYRDPNVRRALLRSCVLYVNLTPVQAAVILACTSPELEDKSSNDYWKRSKYWI